MEDHPRVCGEKVKFLLDYIIAQDHPRVCGEKVKKPTKWAKFADYPTRQRHLYFAK